MAKSATVNPPPASKASRSPRLLAYRDGPLKAKSESKSTKVGLKNLQEQVLAAICAAHAGRADSISNATAQQVVADGSQFARSSASTDDEIDIAKALFAEAPALILLLQTESWSNFAAHLVVKQGVSSKLLVPLGEFLGMNKAELADFLELDRGTIHRRIQTGQALPTHAAESVLRLLELDRMVKDTFATVEDAAGWMRKPHPMLDDESPLEAAKTSFGAERVKEILTALKWGGVA